MDRSIHRSIHLSVSLYLSISPSIDLYTYLYLYLYIYIYIYISISISIYLSTYRSVDLCIHLSVCPSDWLSVYLTIYVICLSKGLSICQRKFSLKSSELQTNAQGEPWHHVIFMSASSCQQQSEHEQLARGSSRGVTARERVKSGVKTLMGAKPCVSSGKVVRAVAEGGSWFLQFRGSIWQSCRQKVHRTVARSRFALENDKKVSRSERFWKMTSAECARGCSGSMRL